MICCCENVTVTTMFKKTVTNPSNGIQHCSLEVFTNNLKADLPSYTWLISAPPPGSTPTIKTLG